MFIANDIIIRKAELNDVKILKDLAWITQLETFEKMNPPGLSLAYLEENMSLEIIENELVDLGSTYYLAEKNEKAIGYLKVRTDNIEENKLAGENCMELQRIYLLAAEKGNGYGKMLLNYAENLAKSLYFDLLWLGVWEKNLPAIAFYKHHGYEFFGEHVFMYGGDVQNDYMMRKKL
jgi:ribosomal protein S18 acetylase RimI-like enzyme